MNNPKATEGKAVEVAMSRLAAIVESSDDGIIGKDLNGIITSWNKGAEKIFGYTAGEMVGTSILRLFPAERHAEEDFILGKIRRGEKVDHFETVRQTKDGRLIDISVTSSPIKDAAGNIIGASKIARDITVRKAHEQEILRLSSLYWALSQINQAIVLTRNREELFEKICRVLVELGRFSMAWIGQADAETRQVKPIARWGDKSDYLFQVKIYMDERPEGRGPVGSAIREGQSYICNDFTQDPNTAPWHELASRAGFRAAAAFPIRQNKMVWGALTVYSDQAGFFRNKEIALLEEAAGDVSFALDFLMQDEKRRQVEAALRESEERYKALFDRSLDCVFLNNFDGKFLDANQAALDLLGYQREDIPALTFASLLTEDQLPLAFQVTEEIKTTGHQKHSTEFRLRGKDGRQVYVETQSALIYREGKPFAIQGVARDLTERKRAEEALYESERLMRLFTLATNDALWNWDLTTGLVERSAGFEKLFGYPREAIKPIIAWWVERIHPDDRARVLTVFESAKAEGKESCSYQYRFQKKDLGYATVLDRVYFVRDATGKAMRCLGAMTDFSEQIMAEAELRQSQQQLRALSARLETLREEERTRISREIHDELGQMLTGIKMDLRSMEHGLEAFGDDRRVNPILDKLLATSELTDATVKTVQRVAAELRPGILDKLGLPTALEYEAAQFETRTGTACRVIAAGDLPPMRPDAATACFRIFQEALTNVARHAGATVVETEFRLEAGSYRLEIRDNGRGLTAADIAKPSSLGLLGMQERARLVRGEVSFGARTGGGTVVTVRIPHRPTTQEDT